MRLIAVVQNIRTEAGGDVESNANTLDTLYGKLSQSQFVPEFTDIDYRVYNATLDFDLGFATLTSATSYNELESPFRSDLTTQFSAAIAPLIGPNELLQNQTTKYDKVTQELRLASPSSDSFEWLVGAYYTKEKGDIIQHIDAVTPGTLNDPLPTPLLADATLHSQYEENRGLPQRHDSFRRAVRPDAGRPLQRERPGSRTAGSERCARGRPTGVLPVATSSEDVFTYSVAPKWKFDDHTSLYVRVASGFRPGGPNVLPPNAPPEVPRLYDSDELTSYEIGLKVESADRAYTLDFAAFHIDLGGHPAVRTREQLRRQHQRRRCHERRLRSSRPARSLATDSTCR